MDNPLQRQWETKMKVALCQMMVSDDKKENLRKVLKSIEKIEADLIIFPEYLMGTVNGELSKEYVNLNSETLDGEFISSIIDKSRELGTSLVFTAFLREKGKIYNASLLVEQGVLRAVYKKVHLFDAFGYKESSIFANGDTIIVCNFKEFKIGLAICFDLRFPELFRIMAYHGANLFIVPSAWYRGSYKIHQWYALTSCRAHENTAWLIAVNQVGEKFIGHSLIASPMGYIHVDLGECEKIHLTEVTIAEVENARRNIPVLKLAKKDFYESYYRGLATTYGGCLK